MYPKPKLIPVEVPWEISAGSDILIRIYESGKIIVTSTVHFIASDSSETIGYSLQEYIIDIVFLDTIWVITNPIHDDHVDFYKRYLLDAVEMPKGFDAFKKYHLNWLENGFCPNPNMYSVIGSIWNPSPALANQGYKHFTVLGRNVCIDVFGNKWTWQNKEKIIYQ